MGPDFKEVITFPLIIYSTPLRDPNGFLASNSQVGLGVSKSPKLKLLQLWSSIFLQVNLGSRCGLKQSYSLRREFSNGMSHAMCRQVNRVDS